MDRVLYLQTRLATLQLDRRLNQVDIDIVSRKLAEAAGDVEPVDTSADDLPLLHDVPGLVDAHEA